MRFINLKCKNVIECVLLCCCYLWKNHFESSCLLTKIFDIDIKIVQTLDIFDQDLAACIPPHLLYMTVTLLIVTSVVNFRFYRCNFLPLTKWGGDYIFFPLPRERNWCRASVAKMKHLLHMLFIKALDGRVGGG